MAPERPWRSDDASGLGPVKPSSVAAARTRSPVASATGPLPLKTREAVDTETPARSATSRSVGRA